MELIERNALLYLYEGNSFVAKQLASVLGCSINRIESIVDSLQKKGYIDEEFRLSIEAVDFIKARTPKNAIILAAGLGMRMIPINAMQPKALVEIDGEPLIERLIKQLHEVNIYDITIVVGFMKGSFEYLIDEFGVDLVVNSDYIDKNNLASLAAVRNRISNTYIVPGDLWCSSNPFNNYEICSWYMVNEIIDNKSDVRVDRSGNLLKIEADEAGNSMVGISYITVEDAVTLQTRLGDMSNDHRHDDDFWEESLYDDDRMMVSARVIQSSEVVEINTYEQLRDLDDKSDQLKSNAIATICRALDVSSIDIENITVLKKGMTNRSFLFSCETQRYIMRIPGEGTDQLINRTEEALAYNAISGLGLCDDPVYLNPENGYKITRYLEGVRVCNPDNTSDLEQCMAKLKSFHRMRLSVPHTFDIFERIDFYESLWDGQPSEYRDYASTKAGVLSLRPWVESQPHDWCLTHIDAVPDNFLFHPDGRGGEALQLTDWEYAGMQDPHVDIAMFCIYSMYDRGQVDRLIDIYFADEGGCDVATRAKIYCYVAMCGLLWSNWCEYKRNLGVEFGEYSLAQYRYAKDFRRHAIELAPKIAAGGER